MAIFSIIIYAINADLFIKYRIYIFLDLYSYSYISNIASEMYVYIPVGIFIVVKKKNLCIGTEKWGSLSLSS